MDFKDLEIRIAKRRALRKELKDKRIERLEADYIKDEAKDERILQEAKVRNIEMRKKKDGLAYENYKYNEQKKREKIEFDKSERGVTLKAKEDARQNIERDIKMGLTSQQIRRKYLDTKATIRELNKDAERETDKMLKITNLSKLKVNLKDLVDDLV